MGKAIPIWAKVLLRVEAKVRRASNVVTAFRDEVLLAKIPEKEREAFTLAIYEQDGRYAKEGEIFSKGLFPWEERALASPVFPRHGRILVGGAGAGREVLALMAKGYEVVAFEPSANLRRDLASASVGCTVVQATYGDMVRAVEQRGPAGFLDSSKLPIDGVVLGWGSFSHVFGEGEQERLLRALHRLAPEAPVLFSFGYAPPIPEKAPPGSLGRRMLRGLLHAVYAERRRGVRGGDPTVVLPSGVFYQCVSRGRVEELAMLTGYDVGLFEDSGQPHAILVPRPRNQG